VAVAAMVGIAIPMFGHTKHNRAMGRFHRRGRSAVRTESRLITATHNLTKLHRHTLAARRRESGGRKALPSSNLPARRALCPRRAGFRDSLARTRK
jgi:hypothetical protein